MTTTDDDVNPAAATAKRLETAFFVLTHCTVRYQQIVRVHFPVFCILNLPLLCSLETMECTSGLLPISTEVTAALQLGVTCHDFSDIESGAHIFLSLLRHI